MNYDNFTYDKLGYSYERHAIRVSNMIYGHCSAHIYKISKVTFKLLRMPIYILVSG